MKPHPLAWLLVVLVLMTASGASCPQVVRQYTQPAPRVLPPNATLEQIVNVVNENGSRVHSLSAQQAFITIPGLPALRTRLAAQRERRFRLQASSLLGEEVDLGSNDELFWIWVRRNRPPAVFSCRHDQFASSSARQIMPVEASWLFEALGAVTFDPQARLEGPEPLGSGRVQVRSTRSTAMGQLTKVTVIDDARGWVLEQHLYDERAQRLATALASQHRRDPLTGITMPRKVEIQWPPAKFTMTIELDDLQVNHIAGNPDLLWLKPDYAGYEHIDLADPNLRFAPPGEPTAMGPGGYGIGGRPRY